MTEARRPPEDVELGKDLINLLVSLGATREHASLYLEVRGLLGHPLSGVRRSSSSLSRERVRRIVNSVEENQVRFLRQLDIVNPFLKTLRDLMTLVVSEAPNVESEIRANLEKRGRPVLHPLSVYRTCLVYGVQTDSRIDIWRGADKNHQPSRTWLGEKGTGSRCSYEALLHEDAPVVFDRFLANSRRIARSSGAISARYAAEAYTTMRGIAITEAEAKAMLHPFAVHLGRIEGDDWYVIMSNLNEIVSRASTMVLAMGAASLEDLLEAHRRRSRSEFLAKEPVPEDVVRQTLSLFGFTVDQAGQVTNSNIEAKASGRQVAPVAIKAVEIFRDLVAKGHGVDGAVRRSVLLDAFQKGGIKAVTAHLHLSKSGIFRCVDGLCTLTNTVRREVPGKMGRRKKSPERPQPIV